MKRDPNWLLELLTDKIIEYTIYPLIAAGLGTILGMMFATWGQ